jgi:outer membrane protein OmpA-like peptidoglycan-associated protein
MDGRIGEPYLDFVEAKSLSGNSFNGQQISYSLGGNLPFGLTFNPISGFISGAVSNEAIPGTYNIIISASSSGYPMRQMAFTLRVLPAVLPIFVPLVVTGPALSIVFTDTTLVDARIGKSYIDYVKAKTFIGSTLSSVKVTYLLTGALPSGLSLNATTGYILGVTSKNALVGTYKFEISAIAKGYPTLQHAYELQVNPAVTTTSPVVVIPTDVAVVPDEVVVEPSSIIQPTAPKMLLMSTIWFDSGNASLTSSTKLSLDSLLISIKKSDYKNVAINGFTDAAPGQSHLALSLARASAVQLYLLSRKPELKITINGLGLAPASKNSTKSSQASRKAEIWVG